MSVIHSILRMKVMVEGADIGMHSQPSCVEDLKNTFKHYSCLTV